RHIRDRYVRSRLARRPLLRYGDIGGDCRAPEPAQVEFDDFMPGDLERAGDASSGLDLLFVPLAIAKRECVDRKTVALCQGERGGRIDAATQQDDGSRFSVMHA